MTWTRINKHWCGEEVDVNKTEWHDEAAAWADIKRTAPRGNGAWWLGKARGEARLATQQAGYALLSLYRAARVPSARNGGGTP